MLLTSFTLLLGLLLFYLFFGAEEKRSRCERIVVIFLLTVISSKLLRLLTDFSLVVDTIEDIVAVDRSDEWIQRMAECAS